MSPHTIETTDLRPPAPLPNVYALISTVSAELAAEGISKDRTNQTQNYNFRGVDDVYNALAPVLSRHGLVILPRFSRREITERQGRQGGTLFFVTVFAEFDFVSAHDGSLHTVSTFGEAMDSGDKATNKAMSAAYKYACFQTFCIPTEGDHDSENQTHRVEPPAGAAPVKPEPAGPPTQIAPAAPSGPPKVATPVNRPAPVVPHPSVPTQPPAAEPSAAVLVSKVEKKRSGENKNGPWNLWVITFTGKVKASDGTVTNRASTFSDELAASADTYRAQERPVLPVVIPSDSSKGSYDLQKIDVPA